LQSQTGLSLQLSSLTAPGGLGASTRGRGGRWVASEEHNLTTECTTVFLTQDQMVANNTNIIVSAATTVHSIAYAYPNSTEGKYYTTPRIWHYVIFLSGYEIHFPSSRRPKEVWVWLSTQNREPLSVLSVWQHGEGWRGEGRCSFRGGVGWWTFAPPLKLSYQCFFCTQAWLTECNKCKCNTAQ